MFVIQWYERIKTSRERSNNSLTFTNSGSSRPIGPEIRRSQHQSLPLLHHQAIHKGTSTGEGGEWGKWGERGKWGQCTFQKSFITWPFSLVFCPFWCYGQWFLNGFVTKGFCNSDEKEEGVCHLFIGGAVPGDGGSSLQVPGAASWEVSNPTTTVRRPLSTFEECVCCMVVSNYLKVMTKFGFGGIVLGVYSLDWG